MKNLKYITAISLFLLILTFSSAYVVIPQNQHTESYYQYVYDTDYSRSGASSSSTTYSDSYSASDSSRYSSPYRRSPYSSSTSSNENIKSSSSSKSSSSFSESESSHLMITEYSYVNTQKYQPAQASDKYLANYQDYGYTDYRYDYSPDHYRDYYGSPDYYYTYSPYSRTYEERDCYHYPPYGKLFYTKCPNY